MLSVTRQIMKGRGNRFPGGPTKWANIEFTKFKRGCRNISTLDRDEALAQDGIKVCAHCGNSVPKFHQDHVIPRSKLSEAHIRLNQVRSCPQCNMNRGNKELMYWHRQRHTFPTLGVLRRYLKLCYFFAKQDGCLDVPAGSAVEDGLPFDPRLLPRKFPAVEHLVWDYAYPES